MISKKTTKTCFALTALFAVNIMFANDHASLQSMIDKARKNNQRELIIPKNTYRLDKPLVFDKLKDIKIDGGGSTFLFTDIRANIMVVNSDQLTLQNFTVDYSPLPFTQGDIITVEPAAGRMRIKLHAGYPSFPRMNRINVHIFDRASRSWKKGVRDYFGLNLTATDKPDEFYVKMPEGFSSCVTVGDLVAFDWRFRSGFNIRNTNDFRMYDVTIHTSPSIAILGRFTTGKHHFERISICRGPLPEGATEARLLSASADGLNYAYCEKGPDVINCDFSFIGDDSINYHSVALPIVKVESPTSILVLRPYPREGFPEVIKRGMELRLLDNKNFRVMEKGNIVSCKFEPGVDIPVEEVSALFRHYHPERDPRRSVYRLVLEKPMNFKTGLFVDIPPISGEDFVIRDNYFHDHRARAIRMMASNGVIENNRIERIKQNAITVGGEYAYWREAGWVENLIIRNNTIKDVGLDERLTSQGSYAPGAISLIMRSEEGVSDIASGNRNILIENNLINGCSGPGIVLHAVDGAIVRGNTIENVCYGDLSKAGADYGFKISAPIETTPSAINVKLENNQIK
jgi:parallel beta-helix repeat protein